MTHRPETQRVESRDLVRLLPAGLVAACVLLAASLAGAGIHTWDVREVFSNASGSIQYIELFDSGAGGLETGVGNGSLTSTGQSHSWSNGPVAPPTNGKSYLIASASFAALPGAPTPDVIIPASKVPFFNVNGDTVGFAGVDSWTFGAVPTNGTDSLNRITGVGANTPKNYAGVQGNVNGNPPPVPSASFWMMAALVSSLAAMGALLLRRRPAAIG
jgi:hypothetical protein